MKCGKICFDSKQEAENVMRVIRSRQTGITPLRVYRCGNCKAYHFTSRPKRKPRT